MSAANSHLLEMQNKKRKKHLLCNQLHLDRVLLTNFQVEAGHTKLNMYRIFPNLTILNQNR